MWSSGFQSPSRFEIASEKAVSWWRQGRRDPWQFYNKGQNRKRILKKLAYQCSNLGKKANYFITQRIDFQMWRKDWCAYACKTGRCGCLPMKAISPLGHSAPSLQSTQRTRAFTLFIFLIRTLFDLLQTSNMTLSNAIACIGIPSILIFLNFSLIAFSSRRKYT